MDKYHPKSKRKFQCWQANLDAIVVIDVMAVNALDAKQQAAETFGVPITDIRYKEVEGVEK